MSTALLLSPHLDDVVFSCGGLAAHLVDGGWRVVMATAFTRTVHPATGFALACQLDKGLSPDVDYMALRRDEDCEAASVLGIEPRWLDLPEAPHRGYGSAPALFGPVRDGDEAWRDLADLLRPLLDELRPDLVAVPQGLGDHVDHRQVIRAALAVCDPGALLFYRDTPYVIRNPGARAAPGVPGGPARTVPLDGVLDRKLDAACAYASQVGFQFGGPGPLRDALAALAAREGGERFVGTKLPPLPGHDVATK